MGDFNMKYNCSKGIISIVGESVVRKPLSDQLIG